MLMQKLISILVGCALLLGFGLDVRATAAMHAAAAEQSVRPKSRRQHRRAAVKKMSDKTTPARLATGTWGGNHIRLSVRADGAAVEFDCARGTIDEALTVSADGRFAARGTFAREGPGPIRVGAAPSARPARYEGSLNGQQLTLKITLSETAQDVGTFTLTRGSAGRLWKCR